MTLISPKSVERIYGVSTTELRWWRQTGQGPEFYRISPRIIRYGTDDLDKWFHDPANKHLHDFPVHESPKPYQM